NYTSHIPCNGLEEPKSTESYGLGVQAVFSSPDGTRVGFGSEPSNLSIEGVKRALEKARKGAVRDPEFVSLPKPTREAPKRSRYHDLNLMEVEDEDLVGVGWANIEGGLEVFQASESLLLAAGDRAKVRDLGLILGGDVTILQETIAVGSSHFPQVQTDESTLIMSFITAMIEGADSKGTGWATATSLREFSGGAGADAARNAINAMGGQRVPSGEYRVIFGRQPVTDLVNNILLPSLSTSTFYASGSPFMGKLGQPVASEQLSIWDHGAAPGLVGTKNITCEGLPTGKTELIRNGILVGLLSNYYETQRLLRDPKAAEKLGVEPDQYPSALVPRNGFRYGSGGGRSFESQPGIYATNVIVEGSDGVSLEELARRVGDGIYVGRIWYTYPINGLRAGDFTCTVVGDSYMIRDGELSTPIKANVIRINDNILRVLNSIIGITKERKGTLVWAADEVVYAPEIAVEGVSLSEIGVFLEQEAM
ncbi:MAG: TldD/PmbA family protein, partial [Dehalococcoidia bacterium]